MFDFVNPVLALWRLIDQGRKLGLDESKPDGYAKHEGFCSGEMFERKHSGNTRSYRGLSCGVSQLPSMRLIGRLPAQSCTGRSPPYGRAVGLLVTGDRNTVSNQGLT